MKRIGAVLLVFCLFAVISACKTDKKSKNTVSSQKTVTSQEADVIESPDIDKDIPELDFETGKIIENTSGSSKATDNTFEEAGSSAGSEDSSVTSDSTKGKESSTVSSGTQSTTSSSSEGMAGWEPFS